MEISTNRKLLLIFCAVFVVRLVQLFTVFSISGDGPVYIDAARDFYEGDFKAGLAHDNPPLYSLLIASAYSVTRNWVVAGRFISFVFGLLTVFPVYFFAKDVFGKRVGSITAILFAFHPFVCKYPARVLTEATYIFFFACSVWLCWRAISKKRYSLYLWAGSVSGLSYLVRPEGLGVVIVTGLYLLLQAFSDFRHTYKKRLISVCVLGLGVMVCVAPYLLYVRGATGNWQLSKKKSIVTAITTKVDNVTITSKAIKMAKTSPQARILSYSRIEKGYLKTLLSMVLVFVKVYFPTLFLLLLFGLVRRKIVPRRKGPELFISSILIFHILVFSLFYVSDRHLVPLVSVCLFWAAIGFYELYHLVLMKMPSVKVPNLSEKTFIILLIAVIFTLLPYVLRPQDRDKRGQKRVGKWIRENCTKSPYIFTEMARIVFYANGYFVPFQNRPGISNYDDLVRFAKKKHPGSFGYDLDRSHNIDYIVIDKSRIARYCPGFLGSVDSSDLEVIHVQPKLSHSDYGELIVYKVK